MVDNTYVQAIYITLVKFWHADVINIRQTGFIDEYLPQNRSTFPVPVTK